MEDYNNSSSEDNDISQSHPRLKSPIAPIFHFLSFNTISNFYPKRKEEGFFPAPRFLDRMKDSRECSGSLKRAFSQIGQLPQSE